MSNNSLSINTKVDLNKYVHVCTYDTNEYYVIILDTMNIVVKFRYIVFHQTSISTLYNSTTLTLLSLSLPGSQDHFCRVWPLNKKIK